LLFWYPAVTATRASVDTQNRPLMDT
jgi:hypothetical protein